MIAAEFHWRILLHDRSCTISRRMDEAGAPAGRPRGFDAARALDRAMSVFWDYGYARASYALLEAETGLHRQSLRYAFGDKEALFRRAIERYAERRGDEILAALTGGATPLAGIEAAFALWVRAADHRLGRGCLIVNAMAERGLQNSPAMIAARGGAARVRAGFEAAFRAAQEAGEIRRGPDPATLAVHAAALADGLIVNGRGGALHGAAGPVLAGFLAMLKP